MMGSEGKTGLPETGPGMRRAGAWFALLVVILIAAGVGGFRWYHSSRIGPVQPIPFSHKVHAGSKKIGCLFCHTEAMRGMRSGIPPLEKCLLCHSRIAIHYAPIADLRERYFSGRGVEWVRVNYLPEFVYFPHSMHIHRGIDCGECHGNVLLMDRIEKAQKFQMGFCITCHRRHNATHDCFACHR